MSNLKTAALDDIHTSLDMPKNFSPKSTPLAFLKWFVSRGYAQGVFWAIMICVVSVTNDLLMNHLGGRLHVVEISFFRFLFSMLSVLPLMLSRGTQLFKTEQPMMHVWRAVIGACALGLCCYSVNIMPLAENTTIMFVEPLFFLILAFFILGERVNLQRWMATGVGFLGLSVILQPGTEAFQIVAFVPMTAAILFAILNIMAKTMIRDEHSYTLLFYFGLGTTLFALIPACFFWQTPTLFELFLLALLGIGGNMIQVCLFRAFSATEASGLAPFRYVEFIVAAVFGYLILGQIPTLIIMLGAALIIASTFYITVVETRREKRDRADGADGAK
ncbi:DMT family transporter [Candidatus Finniella inopinata]|uniref:DMT family transporter n=1 Tax=Candidatus Finniella inopinata TaxID=1696036 RepID=A0A4Q7DJN7_9PROT|nr:DMT family transporter [Candidatus Finniella inopinata]RZI46570.1 DMT family transporter [Candidatus Finniella inopinata]